MANVEITPERARRFFEDKLSFTLGPGELDAARKAERVRIVDVRTKEDFDAAHIPGSVNLPRTQWNDATTGESALAKDLPNVFLCYTEHCPLSAQAAAAFAAKGYAVKELTGGFDAWKQHGLPTESTKAEHEEPVARTRAFLAEKRATEADATKKAPPPAPNAKSEEKPAHDEKAKEPPKNDKQALSDTREAKAGAAEHTTSAADVEKDDKAPTQEPPAVSAKPAEAGAQREDDVDDDAEATGDEAKPASGRRPRPASTNPEEPTSQRVVK